jgi:hypothetical protein
MRFVLGVGWFCLYLSCKSAHVVLRAGATLVSPLSRRRPMPSRIESSIREFVTATRPRAIARHG